MDKPTEPVVPRIGKHRLRSGLPITNDLRLCMPKSLRSIVDITTKASLGQTTSVTARRRLWLRSLRLMISEICGVE
jgi:hypothetical protein